MPNRAKHMTVAASATTKVADIPTKISEKRKAKQLSQMQLAEELGVSQALIAKAETGSHLALPLARELAHFLDLDFSEMVDWITQKQAAAKHYRQKGLAEAEDTTATLELAKALETLERHGINLKQLNKPHQEEAAGSDLHSNVTPYQRPEDDREASPLTREEEMRLPKWDDQYKTDHPAAPEQSASMNLRLGLLFDNQNEDVKDEDDDPLALNDADLWQFLLAQNDSTDTVEPSPYKSAHPERVSNTSNWTSDDIKIRLELVSTQYLAWDETSGSARKWWDAFLAENEHRMRLVLRLAEELAARDATITQFFMSYLFSVTDNIQGNLDYHDWKYAERATTQMTDSEKAEMEARARYFQSRYQMRKAVEQAQKELKNGNAVAAIRILRPARTLFPTDRNVRQVLGEIYKSLAADYRIANDFKNAERVWLKYLLLKPEDWNARFYMADFEADRLQNSVHASALLRPIIQRKANNAADLLMQASALQRLGQKDDALGAIEKAKEISSKDGDQISYASLGSALTDVGQFKEALEALEKAIEMNKKDGLAYFNLACVHALRDEKTKSIAALKTAIGLDTGYRISACLDKCFDSLWGNTQFKKLVSPEPASG